MKRIYRFSPELLDQVFKQDNEINVKVIEGFRPTERVIGVVSEPDHYPSMAMITDDYQQPDGLEEAKLVFKDERE